MKRTLSNIQRVHRLRLNARLLVAVLVAAGGLSVKRTFGQAPVANGLPGNHPANVHEVYPNDPSVPDLNRGSDFDDRFEPDLEGQFRNEWLESYWEEEIEDDRADRFFVEAYDRAGNDYTIDYDYDYDYGRYDEPGDDVADYDDVADNAFDYEGQFAYGNDELDYRDVYDDRYYEQGYESFVEVPFEGDAVADYAESGVLGDKEYERFYENYGAFDPQADPPVNQRGRPERPADRSIADDVREDIIDDDYDIVGSELSRDDAPVNQLSDAAMREGAIGESSRRRPKARGGADESSRQPLTARVSGTVGEIVRFELLDGKEHIFAKLQTDQGQTIPVDLGTEPAIKQLGGIADGDRITVRGRVARVNDRRVMRASTVQSGDRSASIESANDRDLKRVRGQISALRTTRFKNHDGPFRVARVELNSGRSEVTILGPVDKLRDIDLQPGDDVRMLVRRGRYNERPVLVADQIRSGERVAQISEPRGETFQPPANR